MVSEKTATEPVLGLRDYELTVVTKPDLAEDKLETTINNISQFITDRGGAVSEIQRWGKRKLAYPIKRYQEGIYVLGRVKMRPATGREIEANLRISEDVLRHLLVKVGD